MRTAAPAHHDDLGAVLGIGRAVATAAPLPRTLSTIAARAAELVAADRAGILLLDDRGRLRYAARHGLSAAYGENFRLRDPRMPVSGRWAPAAPSPSPIRTPSRGSRRGATWRGARGTGPW